MAGQNLSPQMPFPSDSRAMYFEALLVQRCVSAGVALPPEGAAVEGSRPAPGVRPSGWLEKGCSLSPFYTTLLWPGCKLGQALYESDTR